MRKSILFIAAGLVLALAQMASAAPPSGAICNVAKGTAIIADPGLNGSGPLDLPFAFSNDCGSTITKGCAVGVLGSATCAENVHSGGFVYCAGEGSCSLDCGLDDCDSTNIADATIAATADCDPVLGNFQGLCLGNLCLGSATADVLYLLAFDQETSDAALATCPPAPLGPGGSLTSASFTGVIVY